MTATPLGEQLEVSIQIVTGCANRILYTNENDRLALARKSPVSVLIRTVVLPSVLPRVHVTHLTHLIAIGHSQPTKILLPLWPIEAVLRHAFQHIQSKVAIVAYEGIIAVAL